MIITRKKNWIKTASGLLAVIILVAALLAEMFPLLEMHHVCHEEECPVCETIRLCEGVVRVIGAGITATLTLFFFKILREKALPAVNNEIFRPSPVTKKVRLND